MQIIQATSAHLDEITRLFDAYRVFYRKPSDVDGARQFLAERLNLEDSVIFLSKEEATSVFTGFVQLYPLFSSTRMAKLWLLNDLYVDPAYRGRAFGKALIERAKTLARDTNAAGLMLETEKSNTIGNNLYPATGFELIDGSNFYFWTKS